VSSRQRVVLLAIAAVVLVGGILLASSSGDEDEPAGGETTAAQTTPAETGTPDGEQPPAAEEEQAPPPPRVETIRMRDRAPVGEPQTLRFERGETIRLRFVSDAAEEVHIHGFDRYVQVLAGAPKRERFKATLEGIFEVEAHSTGELLAKLEIRPE
jgi:hypothetical protein